MLRRTKVFALWFLTVVGLGCGIYFVPKKDEALTELLFLSATGIIALVSTCSLIILYKDNEMWPKSGYFIIGGALFFPSCMIGLLATDLSFTLKNQATQNMDNQDRFSSVLTMCWGVVYWSNILFGTVLKPFYQQYWQSGHYSKVGRAKFACKRVALKLLIVFIFVVVLCTLGFIFWDHMFFKNLNIALMLLLTIYGMTVLVLLLGYGLAFLPAYFWKMGDREANLYNFLLMAPDVSQQYKEARKKYMEEVSKCRNMARDYSHEANEYAMNRLLDEIPLADLEGKQITHLEAFKREFKNPNEVGEAQIADARRQLLVSYFLYKRKRSRWFSLFNKVISMTKPTVDLEEEYLHRKIDINFEVAEGQLPELKLQLTKTYCCRAFYKVIAIIIGFYALLILGDETTLLFLSKEGVYYLLHVFQDKIWFTFFFTYGVVLSMVSFAFFTVFMLKFSDYVQLVYKHTDCLCFSSFTGLFSKIMSVTCFNYMCLAGELNVDDGYETSFQKFYSKMLHTPFLGEQIEYILSGSIILFAVIFIIISFTGHQAKGVNYLRNRENKEKRNKKVKGSTKTQLEKIFMGEICILKELKLRDSTDLQDPEHTANVQEEDDVDDESDESDEDKSGEGINSDDSIQEDNEDQRNQMAVRAAEQEAALQDYGYGINQDDDQDEAYHSQEEDYQDQQYNHEEQVPLYAPSGQKVEYQAINQDKTKQLYLQSMGDLTESSQALLTSTDLQANEDDLNKEGYLQKKSSKSKFGITKWDRRYFVLKEQTLYIYHSEADSKIKGGDRKVIDLARVSNVCFHYDIDAPVKSKKLTKTLNTQDESRFDIYAEDRVYQLKADEVWCANEDLVAESGGWIDSIRAIIEKLA